MADAGTTTLDTTYTLAALSAVIILLRLVLRRLCHERFALDDLLMGVAVGVLAFYTAGVAISIYNGTNLNQEHPMEMDEGAVARVTLGSKWMLAGRPLCMSYIWILKGCMLVYYTRLDLNGLESLTVKGVAGVLLATWFGCMLTFLLECRPIHLYWQVAPDAPMCARAVSAAIMQGVSDIVTVLVIIALPGFFILRSKLPLQTNIQIAFLYILGIFLLVTSILHTVLTLTNLPEQNISIWPAISLFNLTLLTNAPIIRHSFTHTFQHKGRGRFSRDECPPSYTLAIHTATESEADVEDQPESRVTSLSGGLRKSIKQISDKVRRSLEIIQIQTSVELLQESKQGRMEGESEGGDALFIGGPRAGAGTVAQINSYVTTGSEGWGAAR